ncbi:hypothetical protein ACFYXC_40165 [Streptomyces sp. NPDC002701]|uniref:hypothetical protein n=1 Tax=Streptomyces sp. NPDC002701 TaxID=3364661 RepID=UPI003688678A
MTKAQFTLEGSYAAKGLRYMREIRRAILAYWYATMEDPEAAALEVRRVASAVNILDEAVFVPAHGDSYCQHRAHDPLGKVVMGLELIRNCEEHSPVLFEQLLEPMAHFSVPVSLGPTPMRVPYSWALYADMPARYVQLDPGATTNQKRARAEAQDAYRKEVGGRPVIDTLFDAVRFFQALDPRLTADDLPVIRWAFAESDSTDSLVEIPDTDPRTNPPRTHLLYRPLGLDQYEVFLPDIACRHWERRSARWPAWDKTAKTRKTGLLAQAKNRNPPGPAREVRYRLIDEGKVIGYSGMGLGAHGLVESWTERTRQVVNDINRGYRYFVRTRDIEIPLQRRQDQGVEAVGEDGRDILSELEEAGEELRMDVAWLHYLEENPDEYLQTRPRSEHTT